MPDKERTLNELKSFLKREWEEKYQATVPLVYEGQAAPDLEQPENMKLYKTLAKAEKDVESIPDPYISPETLNKHIASELAKLYPERSKRPTLAIRDIRERMNTLRQMLLDEIDKSLYEIGNNFFISNEPGVNYCTVPMWLNEQYSVQLYPRTNNPRKLMQAYFPAVLQELVEKKLFMPSDYTSDSVLQILNEYNKVLISINRIHLQRDKGEFAYEKQFNVPSIASESVQDKLPVEPAERKLLLSEFIAQFVDTKVKDGKWEKRAIPVHKNRIDVLVDVLGDIPVDDIDRKMMRRFRDVLKLLPPNRSRDKKYRGKSIQEILEMKPERTLSIGTIDTTLVTISGMFEWGIREELIEKNPAKDLGIADPEQDIEKKDALTEADIKTIFFSGDYKPDGFKNPAYYWVPLIALYTGMRLEEICQLHTEDVYQEDDVWIFDIRLDSTDGLNDKILKNKNAARKVPIHKDLIELGFLDYLKRTAEDSIRLFPDLNKTDKSPKYGKQVGKQFAGLLKRKRITGKKSFHSLRHSFSNYFKQRNLHTDMFTQIMGHKQEKLAASRYGSKFTPKQCYDELICKISWIKD